MKPFETFRSIIAGLDRANVDTDQIIPKQFLKSIARTGFGESLFFDWRYLANGKPNPKFSLNAERFKGATVLITRNNFGCGSSREHAVWAVAQYGFRVLIAPWQDFEGSRIPGFADIFRNNSMKNGILTIELDPAQVDEIFQMIERTHGLEVTVNLEKQSLTVHADAEMNYSFEVDSAVKERLVRGLDDIGLTLKEEDAIQAFEARHNVQMMK